GLLVVVALAVLTTISFGLNYSSRIARAGAAVNLPALVDEVVLQPVTEENGFTVDVLAGGQRVRGSAGPGRRYVEALENAEHELRIHNPLGSRVAVALAVDGMNPIDARHTSAWDAHKWVIEPYGTIYVRGWQMSSENARRFYFTTERDSYGTKIGQTANLGVISAVFFRERGQPVTVTQNWPKPV